MRIERFAICGLDELDLHAGSGMTHVVSILDPEWPEPEAFALYDRHERLRLRFHDVIDEDPMIEIEAPQLHHVEAILQFGDALDGARLLVHCHAGISRSTAATMLLLAQADPARDPDLIVAEIVERRPKAWPNLRMVELGDALLGRRGALVQAARRRHWAVAEARPEIARMMRDGGRAREVDR
jgi:predicted protein tyrosine phosphatase